MDIEVIAHDLAMVLVNRRAAANITVSELYSLYESILDEVRRELKASESDGGGEIKVVVTGGNADRSDGNDWGI